MSMKLRIWNLLLIALYSNGVVSKLNSFSPSRTHKKFIRVAPTDVPRNALGTAAQPDQYHYIGAAKRFVADELGYSEVEDYTVKRNYTSDDKVGHIYLAQVVRGREVFNADINVNVLLDGTILSHGDSFTKTKGTGDSDRFFVTSDDTEGAKGSLINALKVALSESEVIKEKINVSNIKGSIKQDGEIFTYASHTATVRNVKAVQGWIKKSDGGLEPVWSIDIKLKLEYFNVMVSLETHRMVALTNWKAKATYAVYPFNSSGPSDSTRVLVKNPHNQIASPQGWHELDGEKFRDTRGNNAYAMFLNRASTGSTTNKIRNHSPDGGRDLIFNFPLDIEDPSIEKYLNASITNAFYVTNMMHDLLYRYGFDEASGNFQVDNFGRGGKGFDPVMVYVQDSEKIDNASFSTPPDGKIPVMQLGVFDSMQPTRDSAMYNSVIVHEYSHGLTLRLVGGADRANCLYEKEGLWMGEGWGDFFSILVGMKKEYTRATKIVKDPLYSSQKDKSQQSKYLYDLNSKVPTYSELNKISESHEAGHVWTTVLYGVYWNLVDKLGFTADWMNEGARHPTKYGNTLMLKLLINSLKLLKCNPTLINARDALLDADTVLTRGSNHCEIWNGFAARGMGKYAGLKPDRGFCPYLHPKFEATFGQPLVLPPPIRYRNSFTVPEKCFKPKK